MVNFLRNGLIGLSRRNRVIGLSSIVLSLSGLLTFEYYERVEAPQLDMRLQLHSEIVRGTAPNPYRYRVLAPFLADWLAKVIAVVTPGVERLRPGEEVSWRAFSEAYRFFDFLAIAFSLAMLYLLLREWFTPEQSLVGMLFAAATMPITFRNHYFHPWSLLEFGLFALGLLLIHRKRNRAFAVVLLLASLNRETSIFLLMAYCFVRVIRWEGDSLRVDWRSARVFGVYSALWLAIFFGLRILLGFPAPTFTLQEAWIRNTDPQYFHYAIHLNVLFFGFFWIVIFLGYRRFPRFIRRAAGILPFYASLVLVIGLWWEVRYLMTLYPVLIPMGLSYMYLPADT